MLVMATGTYQADKYPLEKDGRLKLEWDAFFQSLADSGTKSYSVAGLPGSAKPGTQAYATNGRKPGQLAGAGTGVLVYFDNSSVWISVHSGVAVTA